MIIEGATKIYFISNENPGNKCPPWPMLTNLSAVYHFTLGMKNFPPLAWLQVQKIEYLQY